MYPRSKPAWPPMHCMEHWRRNKFNVEITAESLIVFITRVLVSNTHHWQDHSLPYSDRTIEHRQHFKRQHWSIIGLSTIKKKAYFFCSMETLISMGVETTSSFISTVDFSSVFICFIVFFGVVLTFSVDAEQDFWSWSLSSPLNRRFCARFVRTIIGDLSFESDDGETGSSLFFTLESCFTKGRESFVRIFVSGIILRYRTCLNFFLRWNNTLRVFLVEERSKQNNSFSLLLGTYLRLTQSMVDPFVSYDSWIQISKTLKSISTNLLYKPSTEQSDESNNVLERTL